MTEVFHVLVLTFLIICTIAIAYIRDLLSAVILFAAYSLLTAVIWQQMDTPDIAMAEAAIGAGVTTLLFVVTISKTRRQE